MLVNNIKGKRKKEKILKMLGEELDKGILNYYDANYGDIVDEQGRKVDIHCFSQFDEVEKKLYELMYINGELKDKTMITENRKYMMVTRIMNRDIQRYGLCESN